MIWILVSAAFAAPPAVEAVKYQLPDCERLEDRRETSRQLAKLRAQDEHDRAHWSESIADRDAARVSIVRTLVSEGRICSPQDHYDAAWILQRSTESEDQLRAHVFAFHALASGMRKAEKLTAVAYDRWLVSRGLPQWYGTQYRTDSNMRTCLIEVDPQAPDAERVAVGLPRLTDVVRRAQERNGREPIAEGVTALEMNGLYCPALPWEDPAPDAPGLPFANAIWQ
jgi:hypothetical protein